MSSRRTALFLYVMLVVLPAVVFGSLLWRQLARDQDRRLQALPIECADAAERLGYACLEEVLAVNDTEYARPFEHYRDTYFVDDLGPIHTEISPLASDPRPEGILGWFTFTRTDLEPGEVPTVRVLRGPETSLAAEADSFAETIELMISEEIMGPLIAEGRPASDELRDAEEFEGYGDLRERVIRAVVLNVADGLLADCRDAVKSNPELLKDATHDVYVQHCSLRIVPRGPFSAPWVIAYRNVVIPRYNAPNLPSCIEAISHDVLITQGYVFDPDWLYERMPRRAAARVLSSSQTLVVPGEHLPDNPDVSVAEFDVLDELEAIIDSESIPPDGLLAVKADAGELRRGFRVQNAWFVGMALVLTVSMTIGILLLLSSIQASRDEAQRTRNFVASVTHELRTPIAAVKLYGEMLSDGWVTDEKRKSEYLDRIVHESDRLGGLVDRVLLRRKLFDQDHAPTPGDLNADILQQRADLEMVAGRNIGDLEFDLAPDLPPVLLLPEGIHVVVQNLVENARKYAPIEMGANGPIGEKLVVRTRVSQKGNVLLEVLDRGPGIPERDRSRVFEAFLRLGDESTRSTKGTGLGLHLVALQARAMKGRVRALPRTGGGTVMQVRLKRA